jgi:hypothetical protein
VDGLEQESAHQLAKPPINRLPGPEMDWQHLPAASRADQIAHRIDHLAGPATPRRLWHQRCAFLIRQVRRVALGLPGNLGHPATALLRPHSKLEAQIQSSRNPSGQISKRPLRTSGGCPSCRLALKTHRRSKRHHSEPEKAAPPLLRPAGPTFHRNRTMKPARFARCAFLSGCPKYHCEKWPSRFSRKMMRH